MKHGLAWPARNHAAYWAFWLHRVSGLLLAGFLPLHFLLLGQALHGAAALDGALRLVDQPGFKFAEWALVVLLALHLVGGLRVLVLESLAWRGLRKDAFAWGLGLSFCVGLGFVLNLFS